VQEINELADKSCDGATDPQSADDLVVGRLADGPLSENNVSSPY